MVITSLAFIDCASMGRIPTKDGATVNLGGMTREAVVGDNGVAGYTETPAVPSIKATLIDTTALDKETLNNMVDETVVLSTNNGQQFVLTGAFVANPVELNAKDGTIEVEWHGTKCTQQQ